MDLPEQKPITKRNTPVTGGAPTTPGQAYHSETHSKITKIYGKDQTREFYND